MLLTVVALTACDGDNAALNDHRQKVNAALEAGDAEAAIDLAERALKNHPDDAQLRLLLGRAQLRMGQMTESRAAIDRAITLQPDEPEPRRVLAAWLFMDMGRTLRQTDFLDNDTLGERFQATAKECKTLADWFEKQGDDEAEAHYLRGRLAEAQTTRVRRVIKAHLARAAAEAARVGDAGAPEKTELIAGLSDESESHRHAALDAYRASLAKDPRRFDAAKRYADLCVMSDDEADLWSLAEQLSKQADLSATAVESVVLQLLAINSERRPREERLKLGFALNKRVADEEKASRAWLLTGARLAMASDDPAPAEPLLDRANKVERGNTTVRFLRARLYFQLGKHVEAKAILNKMATDKRTKALPRVHYLLALTHERLGDKTLAIQSLLRVMELDPFDAAARDALVPLRVERRGVPQLANDIRERYQEAPADPANIALMLRLEMSSFRHDAARQVLERAELLTKLTPKHLRTLADGFTRLGELDKAETYARQLIEEQPDGSDGLQHRLRLADILLRKRDDTAVIALVDDIRQRFPGSPSADLTLGRLYLEADRYDKAINHLEKAVQLDPADVQPRFLLARALERLSLIDSSMDQVQRILQDDPRHVRALALASRLYERRGDQESASDTLARIDVKRLDEAHDAPLLARLKLRLGRMDEAARICMRGIAAGNKDPVLPRILSDVYERSGQPQAADDILNQVQFEFPDAPASYFDIATLYQRRGDVEAGLVLLRKLEHDNRALARIAQAALLADTNQHDKALELLGPVLEQLMKDRKRLMWSVAREMARLHLLRLDYTAAQAVYDRLIESGLFVHRARLAKLEVAWPKLDDVDRLAQLDGLAEALQPDDLSLRERLIDRYVALRKFDRALQLIDAWVEQQPNRSDLRRRRAELWIETGRVQDAVRELGLAAALSPNDPELRIALARAHVRAGDFPAAEQTLRDMAQIDAGALILSHYERAEFMFRIGLHAQSIAALDALAKAGRPDDPRVHYLRGRALIAMRNDNDAREALSKVPQHAPQYVAAQLLLVRVEQRLGQTKPASQRVEALASDPRTAQLAATQLFELAAQSADDEQLLAWSDKALAIDRLPIAMKRDWLTVRVGVAARRADWQAVAQALDTLAQLDPASHSIAAGRILVRLVTGNAEEAKQLFDTDSPLAKGELGAAVALSLGLPPTADLPSNGVAPLFAHLAANDLSAAREALKRLPESRWLFRQDLTAMLEGIALLSDEQVDAARKTLAIMLAIELGLPEIAVALCDPLIEQHPAYVPAHALRARALQDMNQPIDEPPADDAPWAESAFGQYLRAVALARADEFEQAATLLESLRQQEPRHQHVRYVLAQVLYRQGDYDGSLKIFETLALTRGRYQFSALNDLAYLLAERFPAERQKAYKLAKRLEPAAAVSPALSDTIGWIEHLQDRNDAALRHLTRAALAAGDLPAVQYHLGVVYHKLGQSTWARYYLQAAATQTTDREEVALAKQMLETIDDAKPDE